MARFYFKWNGRTVLRRIWRKETLVCLLALVICLYIFSTGVYRYSITNDLYEVTGTLESSVHNSHTYHHTPNVSIKVDEVEYRIDANRNLLKSISENLEEQVGSIVTMKARNVPNFHVYYQSVAELNCNGKVYVRWKDTLDAWKSSAIFLAVGGFFFLILSFFALLESLGILRDRKRKRRRPKKRSF